MEQEAVSALLEHVAELAPAEELVGFGVRYLREPRKDGGDYRGLGSFHWCPPTEVLDAIESYTEAVGSDEWAEQWHWVHEVCGGPKRCATHRYLHGLRVPGALLMRLVTCSTVPANGGGTLDELSSVLGLPIDLDIAERRAGDSRRYCPTVGAGRAFLERFAPTVTLDAGGGLVAVWMFDRPADPHAARQLGRDLHDAIERAAREHGWVFDSPTPYAAWVKVPGVTDEFRRHVTTEIATGRRWSFPELRAAVPASPVRRHRSWHYAPQEIAS